MKYIWGSIWTFALMQMTAYVVSAMTGGTYDFMQATVLSVIVTVLIFVIGALIPNEPAPSHDHH